MSGFLPKQAILEYQKLFSKSYGEMLSDDEAQVRAEDFIQVFDLITTQNQNEQKLHPNTKSSL